MRNKKQEKMRGKMGKEWVKPDGKWGKGAPKSPLGGKRAWEGPGWEKWGKMGKNRKNEREMEKK